MRQYLDASASTAYAIVFFRMGDFYEMFYEDALVAARALELTLTSRSKDAGGQGIPMCGVPFHAADGYLARLVKKGFRVAVCEQVEDPRKAKGLVRREVVRVVSPGTFTDAGYLDAREPAFLMSLAAVEDAFGVALIDLSTGEFTAAEYHGADGRQALADEIAVLHPREIIFAVRQQRRSCPIGPPADPLTPVDVELRAGGGAPRADRSAAQHGLQGFGLEGRTAAVQAAGALVAYLRDTQKSRSRARRAVSYRAAADCLIIDPIHEAPEVVAGSEGGRQARSSTRSITRPPRWAGVAARLAASPAVLAGGGSALVLDAVEELAFGRPSGPSQRHAQDHSRRRTPGRPGGARHGGPARPVALRQSLAAVLASAGCFAEVQAPLLRSLVAELDELTASAS